MSPGVPRLYFPLHMDTSIASLWSYIPYQLSPLFLYEI